MNFRRIFFSKELAREKTLQLLLSHYTSLLVYGEAFLHEKLHELHFGRVEDTFTTAVHWRCAESNFKDFADIIITLIPATLLRHESGGNTPRLFRVSQTLYVT